MLSAGCHSGYNIVDGAASAGLDQPFDWTQRMAQQHAVLIGGTGYQYGDTDFLEYSERLYLDLARRLHEAPAPGTGSGRRRQRAGARQAGLPRRASATLTGIDQKAVLQATLYGLPMTGFDAPAAPRSDAHQHRRHATPVTTGTRRALGLATATLGDDDHTRRQQDRRPGAQTGDLEWLNGADGVTVQPGAPALPKQVEDVTVAGQVLRGVGFRGGDYTDTSGVAAADRCAGDRGLDAEHHLRVRRVLPAADGDGNYFGALGASGRTSAGPHAGSVPARDPNAAVPTNTVRAYSDGPAAVLQPGDRTSPVGQPARAGRSAGMSAVTRHGRPGWSRSRPGSPATRPRACRRSG